MARIPAAERMKMRDRAYRLSAMSASYVEIAKELSVTRQTVAKLVTEEIEARSDEREKRDEKQASIGVYEQIKRRAWGELRTTAQNSLNKSGLLNVILRAQENIDRIEGNHAPVKSASDINLTVHEPIPDVDMELLQTVEEWKRSLPDDGEAQAELPSESGNGYYDSPAAD